MEMGLLHDFFGGIFKKYYLHVGAGDQMGGHQGMARGSSWGPDGGHIGVVGAVKGKDGRQLEGK